MRRLDLRGCVVPRAGGVVPHTAGSGVWVGDAVPDRGGLVPHVGGDGPQVGGTALQVGGAVRQVGGFAGHPLHGHRVPVRGNVATWLSPALAAGLAGPGSAGLAGLDERALLGGLGVLLILAGLAAGLWARRILRETQQAHSQAQQAIAAQRARAEQEIAHQGMGEASLQAFLDRITRLVLEDKLPTSPPDAAAQLRAGLARALTLTTLRQLDGARKGTLLRFLYDAGLIKKEDPIIELSGADLNGAELSRADLHGAGLSRVELRQGNLSQATLYGASLRAADLGSANLAGVDLLDADLPGARLPAARLNWADLRRANLSQADLSRAILYGAMLNGADLTRADLRGADPSKASLVGARMRKASLDEANLVEASLGGVDLIGASLSRTRLIGADLRGANLSGADLSQANLMRADLLAADLLAANLGRAILNRADLRGADLRQAGLSGASLVDANLRGAYLAGAVLHGADLRGAELSGANLAEADLRAANLRGADLHQAELGQARLSQADLRRASLRQASLSGADLSRATLSGTDLRGAGLDGANLGQADLSEADLSAAELRGADLRGATLNRANLRGASLAGAHLGGADLRGAHLGGANLSLADLSGARLAGADLSGANLGLIAYSHETVWPEGFAPPPLRPEGIPAPAAREVAPEAVEAAPAVLSQAIAERVDMGPEEETMQEVLRGLPPLPFMPVQRPPRATPFSGRQAQLAQLMDDLQPGRVVTLWGLGGVGKTALAAEAVWRLAPGDEPPERFPDGIVFHSFDAQPEAALALEAIARAYGERPWPTPAAAAQRALAGRTALLLLDGADKADNLEAVLAVRGACGVLVTTHRALEILEERTTVPPMPGPEAAELLQAWGGAARAADEAAAQRVCQLLGGMPLALRLAGHYLANQAEEAAEYLTWLEASPLAGMDLRGRLQEATLLLLERSLARLSQPARDALSVMGSLGLAPFGCEAVSAGLASAPADTDQALADLVGLGLLVRSREEHLPAEACDPCAAHSYQASHPLIHARARREMRPPDGVIIRLAAYYDTLARRRTEPGASADVERQPAPAGGPGGAGPADGPRSFACPPHEAAGARVRGGLEVEISHIMAVLAECLARQLWEPARSLVWAVDSYLDRQGFWLERLTALHVGLQAAEALDHRRDEGAFLGNLGTAYYTMGQFERAIEHYQRALSVARALGDQPGQAKRLGNLGLAYRAAGQVDRAREALQLALGIFQELHSPYAQQIQDTLADLKAA